LLLKATGITKFSVPIKGQCSKNNFYGSVEIEDKFSILEGQHSQLLKEILLINSEDELKIFLAENQNTLHLIEVILFQRLRTNLEASKTSDLIAKLAKDIFESHLKAKGEVELINALPNCEISVTKEGKIGLILTQIASIYSSQPGLFDLGVYILNNKTKNEFIFSDSPVVFYNMAYKHIQDSGTLGLQSPGLLIFYPISIDKCILFIDKQKYIGEIIDNIFFDITNEFDVNGINKLQLHHSLDSIYFSKTNMNKYIKKLWRQERNTFNKKYSTLISYNEVINGELQENSQLLKSFAEQIPYNLKLSFMHSNENNDKKIKRFRTKKLHDILQESRKNIKELRDKIKNDE